MVNNRVIDVWVDEAAVFAKTEDGRIASYPFSLWSKLMRATKEQQKDFFLSYSGIHWPQIDEDLNFAGMFAYSGVVDAKEEELVYENC
ncbi:MAG: DUF2442 domain-containing protein [Bacteroidales bacterium]|nr:DUF2442 domain-containing protein [Bacteroidales bacterium]